MGGLKQRQARSLKDLKRELHARNEPEKPQNKVEASEDSWAPSGYTAWKLLLSARLCSAVWSGISDCDETYNYWEPMHHLLYGQGLQTWEYDPRYALRSYMYLMVHAVPAWMYSKLLQPNPMLVFYFVRCMLAGICASAEVYFYRGVLHEFGVNVARLCLTFLALSAGMFISSTAFLPSSTSLYCTLLASGAWFHQDYRLAIFFTALSAILSWPFTALLGVPIAVDLVLCRGKVDMFCTWSVLAALAITGPVLMCDTFYYGKPVFASLNIVKYNVFTSHGPDLYGTEPASYYLLNGILNFNLVFLAALAVLPLRYAASFIFGEKVSPTYGRNYSVLLSQLGLYLWLGVFWKQPHKEERFLFPAYPLICLAGALALDTCQRIYNAFLAKPPRNYLNYTAWIAVGFFAVFGVLSVSRVTALYQHYQASTEIWMKMGELEAGGQHATQVCVGKEWHRFPSSFFFPNKSFRLAFLKSEFRGQLPKYYSGMTSDGRLPTMVVHDDFNDENLEEPSRYIQHPGKCHYIVDLDNDAVTERQPAYRGHQNWTEVAALDFLDPAASHPVFRAFYVPFLNSRFCKYNKYVLLKRNPSKH